MPLAEADGLKPVGVLLRRTVEAACARISPTRFRLSGKPFGWAADARPPAKTGRSWRFVSAGQIWRYYDSRSIF